MTRWSIGRNNYYFTSSIYLEEAPWYIFAIENSVQFICHYFPRIPLPKINIVVNDEDTNLRDYYGTTGDLFHVYVDIPIFDWCYKRIKAQSFEFPYNLLKEKYPGWFIEDVNDDYSISEEVQQNKEYSESIEKEFIPVYNKLKDIVSTRMRWFKWSKK